MSNAIWPVAAALAAGFLFACLWRFRVLVRVEFRHDGTAVWIRFRPSGFIPMGSFGLEYPRGGGGVLDISYGFGRALLSMPIELVRFRAFSRRRSAWVREWITPSAHRDVLRSALRIRELRFVCTDLFLPLDALCGWAGVQRLLDGPLLAKGCRFSFGIGRNEGVILEIRLDIVINLVRLSKIKIRILRKKVCSWTGILSKTSCSRP